MRLYRSSRIDAVRIDGAFCQRRSFLLLSFSRIRPHTTFIMIGLWGGRDRIPSPLRLRLPHPGCLGFAVWWLHLIDGGFSKI